MTGSSPVETQLAASSDFCAFWECRAATFCQVCVCVFSANSLAAMWTSQCPKSQQAVCAVKLASRASR
eukprot:5357981-Amphidinium_carterae.1